MSAAWFLFALRENDCMRVKVTVNKKSGVVRLEGAEKVRTVSDLISRLKLQRERVLVKKNGKVVSDLEPVSKKDELEVFQVVYGG